MREHQDRRIARVTRAQQVLQANRIQITRQQCNRSRGIAKPDHRADGIAADPSAGPIGAARPLGGKVRTRCYHECSHRPQRLAVAGGHLGVEDDLSGSMSLVQFVQQIIPDRRVLQAVGIEDYPLDCDGIRREQANETTDMILVSVGKDDCPDTAYALLLQKLEQAAARSRVEDRNVVPGEEDNAGPVSDIQHCQSLA